MGKNAPIIGYDDLAEELRLLRTDKDEPIPTEVSRRVLFDFDAPIPLLPIYLGYKKYDHPDSKVYPIDFNEKNAIDIIAENIGTLTFFQKIYINLECHFIEIFPHYIRNGQMVCLQHVRIAVNYLLQENPAAFHDEPIYSLIQLYERLVESENDDAMITGLDTPVVPYISDEEPEYEGSDGFGSENGDNKDKDDDSNDDDDSDNDDNDDEDEEEENKDDEIDDLVLFDFDDDLQEMMSFEIEKERKLKQEKKTVKKGGKYNDSKKTTPSKQQSDSSKIDSAKEPEDSTSDASKTSNSNTESQNTRLEMAEIDKEFPIQKVLYVDSLPFQKNKTSKEDGKAKNQLSKVSSNASKTDKDSSSDHINNEILVPATQSTQSTQSTQTPNSKASSLNKDSINSSRLESDGKDKENSYMEISPAKYTSPLPRIRSSKRRNNISSRTEIATSNWGSSKAAPLELDGESDDEEQQLQQQKQKGVGTKSSNMFDFEDIEDDDDDDYSDDDLDSLFTPHKRNKRKSKYIGAPKTKTSKKSFVKYPPI
ncbi:unnamed protein product [Ambrosiozyma monospora]|uniref:Unnamed protein product n=1 Tax=Ambrosiozyma monospora TaxID=43982 RepID=A0A9W7DGP2_AMBMO|nr:unnamed protein product [Ambrosiozyma monospora]